MTTIELYDATLRDGMQGEGMSLSAEEKLRVAHRLDELGIGLIEAGFPASNPKDRELFDLLAREHFEQAQIAAFGMTRRRGTRAADDEALVALAECVAPVCTLVGKTWTLHLEKLVKVDREENLRMIAESIAFLRAAGKRVIYDAEHFFDGYRAERAYALGVHPRRGGSGGRDGDPVRHQRLLAALPGGERHARCHRRRSAARCASASTATTTPSAAWPTRSLRSRSGARQVQGTMNGCGERTGNANLVSIIANLQLKLGFPCLRDEQLARLTETAHFVDELLNVTPDPNQAYVGRNAFAHKGGLHVAGVSADAEHLRARPPGARRQSSASCSSPSSQAGRA